VKKEIKMNTDNLTLGQICELIRLFGNNSNVSTNGSASIASSMVGKYVIVRSRNEGLNAGYVEAADDTGVILKDAKRLWYHKPAVKTEAWYEGVANHGLSSDSKVSGSVSRKVIVEDYSMTECTEIARQSIETAVANGN
jgi:hypothetical protein